MNLFLPWTSSKAPFLKCIIDLWLQAIINNEGIEQMAALLPRTESELKQIDCMTDAKIEQYGQQIMAVLKEFWEKVDRREHQEIQRQLAALKNQALMPGGIPMDGTGMAGEAYQ